MAGCVEQLVAAPLPNHAVNNEEAHALHLPPYEADACCLRHHSECVPQALTNAAACSSRKASRASGRIPLLPSSCW